MRISMLVSVLTITSSCLAVDPVQAQPQVDLEYVGEFGSYGSVDQGAGPGQFDNAREVAVDSQNRIIIADRGNSRIHVCDDQGSCTVFGTHGTDPGQFELPQGVTTDSHGHIIVSDFGDPNNRVQICDYFGVCTVIGEADGSALGEILTPNGVDVDSQDRIFVVDNANARVQICDHEGVCTAFDFTNAHGLDVDSQGRILLTNAHNQTVSICDEQGLCSSFGGPGDMPGQFNAPFDLEADSSGRIYVTDRGNNRIQICDYQGNCLAYGAAGTGPGQFDGPKGIALDGLGRIIVTDSNRVQIFRDRNSIAPFPINAGLNDAWFNLATNGQGFLIAVFPDIKQMFLAWFTYDTERPPEDVTAILGEPGHRWLTAQGPYEGDTANLTIFVTEGGIFDAAEPAAETDPAGDGTMTIEFADCTEGLVNYQITSLGISGEIPIQRITPDNVPLCEALEEQLLQK